MANPAGMIDPTKPAKYPVILSDELLGKTSKNGTSQYTAIRYNHKPSLSSEAAPTTARLKKSAKDGSYNLGFEDKGGRFQYNGVRTTEDGKYVLVFDPERQAFILHRAESTFHMNLVRTPNDTSVESLRKQFPHLEVKGNTSTGKKGSTTAGPSKTEPSKAAASTKTSTAKSKPGKKAPVSLPLPNPPPKEKETEKTVSLPGPPPPAMFAVPDKSKWEAPADKKKKRAVSPVEEDDDDDDDFGGLTVEYPDGNPSAYSVPNHFNADPAVLTRRFSELTREVDEEEGGDEDGDGEEDLDVEMVQVENFPRAPSPVPPVKLNEPERYTFDDGDDDDDGEDEEDVSHNQAGIDAHGDADSTEDLADMEADMEAELLKEFASLERENEAGSDSEVSEEE